MASGTCQLPRLCHPMACDFKFLSYSFLVNEESTCSSFTEYTEGNTLCLSCRVHSSY